MIENLYGLFVGMFFGFLLQQARILRYDVQLAMLRFQNMTALKFMFSAMVTSMIVFHWLSALGLVSFKIKAAVLGANVIGGLIFGVGWAMLGYCPATAVGAVGEGRFDALFGIIGGVCGAGAYAWTFPYVRNSVDRWGVLGKITVADWLHVNPWWVVVVFALVGVGYMCYCEVSEL